MSFIQRVLMAVLPEASAKSMEAESREWMHTCSAGMPARRGTLAASAGAPQANRAGSCSAQVAEMDLA